MRTSHNGQPPVLPCLAPPDAPATPYAKSRPKQLQGITLNQSESSPSAEDVAVEDVDERNEVIPYAYTITSFGADFTVDNLVDRLRRGDISIPSFQPEEGEDEPLTEADVKFQRGFIWTQTQVHRFVESLLLGLPVPGIFLVNMPDNRLLVLDGQQRLRSLLSYYDGILRGREFRLSKVQQQFEGKRYRDLDDEDRRRLDNAVIHATIVRQDVPSDDLSSVYLVFERLNTGGTSLQPQEIRVALYQGPFLALLQELDENPDWRALYGRKSKRLKDQELILRYLALLHRADEYSRPMKEFLNGFMGSNRDLGSLDENAIKGTFDETVAVIRAHIGERAFRLKAAVNAAVLDSIMVGVSRRVSRGGIEHPEGIREAYESLLADDNYLEAVSRATADEDSVQTRLQLATETFASLQ